MEPWKAELLKLVSKYEMCEELFWNQDLKFWFNCNDLFFWASSDGETIEEVDLELLEKSFKDSRDYGYLLFVCRKRKMRPQKPYYKSIPMDEHHLFNECGPERED